MEELQNYGTTLSILYLCIPHALSSWWQPSLNFEPVEPCPCQQEIDCREDIPLPKSGSSNPSLPVTSGLVTRLPFTAVVTSTCSRLATANRRSTHR